MAKSSSLFIFTTLDNYYYVCELRQYNGQEYYEIISKEFCCRELARDFVDSLA